MIFNILLSAKKNLKNFHFFADSQQQELENKTLHYTVQPNYNNRDRRAPFYIWNWPIWRSALSHIKVMRENGAHNRGRIELTICDYSLCVINQISYDEMKSVDKPSFWRRIASIASELYHRRCRSIMACPNFRQRRRAATIRLIPFLRSSATRSNIQSTIQSSVD